MSVTNLPDIEPSILPETKPGKRSGYRAQRRIERATSLARSALELFLEEGLAAVTIDQIVNRADLGKGSFYRYFESKEALIGQLIAPVRDELVEAGAACSKALRGARNTDELYAAYHALAWQLAQAYLRWRSVVLLYLKENRGAAHTSRLPILELAREVERVAIELTHAAMEHELIRPLDPNVSAIAVIGAVEQLMYRSYDDPRLQNAPEVATALTQLVLEGVRVRESDESS